MDCCVSWLRRRRDARAIDKHDIRDSSHFTHVTHCVECTERSTVTTFLLFVYKTTAGASAREILPENVPCEIGLGSSYSGAPTLT